MSPTAVDGHDFIAHASPLGRGGVWRSLKHPLCRAVRGANVKRTGFFVYVSRGPRENVNRDPVRDPHTIWNEIIQLGSTVMV